MDEKLSQFCYTDEEKSKSVIVDESSTEDSESECVQKSVNKEKTYITKQSMRDLQLQIIQFSRIRAILTYFNEVRIS